MPKSHPIINAIAPTRICDVGGWTDIRMAGHGSVCNVAVYPAAEVQVGVLPRSDVEAQIHIHAENFGDSYFLDSDLRPCRHPLIEATIRSMEIPEEVSLRIHLFSHAPPGASMGTSASLSVALIGALDTLTEGRLTPAEVALKAHGVETEKLGLECGVQDQLACVYGGVNLIEIDDFPRASVSAVSIPDDVWWEFEQRLILAYIGKPHVSSDIHKKVLAGLGPEPHRDARFKKLRGLARQAAHALQKAHFSELGDCYNANTELQRNLHKSLICEDFDQIISTAGEFDAAGCKVNGAGGDGGSVAILMDGERYKKHALEKELQREGYQILPVTLSRHGLRVWRTVSV